MLATNQYDIANWFMHARVSVRDVAICHHTTRWLINHDALEASSYEIYSQIIYFILCIYIQV